MRLFNKTFLALAGLGSTFGLFAALSSPVDTAGFSVIGGSLGLSQRDFRVFNNFTDASANNNTAANADFPSATGAVQAIWKGHIEWASEAYKLVGNQDSTQPVLGSGIADFDNTYQGSASGSGGTNDNVHSELLDNNPGGTLAFTETPISDGWRIFYLSAWSWQDGPGTVSSGIDLQGVACHEIGHSLGLGHSGVNGATMEPAISGTGQAQRSIATDDQNGLRSIYGDKSAGKVRITGISGQTGPGGTLTITGNNFTATDNVVWFTDPQSNGDVLKVSGVPSSGGGTTLNVVIPAGADDGGVLVKAFFSGGASLSNEWPIDITAPINDPPNITSLNPTSGPAGGFTDVVITGTGFNGTSSVTFGGNAALSFTVNNATQITATTPPGTNGSSVNVVVTDPDGSDTQVNGFTYTANPVPNITSVVPNSGPAAGGTVVTVNGTSVLGVTQVTFNGVPGTGLTLIDDTSLTVTTPPGLGSVNVVATNSQGSDTIVGGYTYVAGGSFVNIGPSGIGGSLGEPVFTGSGDLTPGSLAGFTLTCTNAQPFSLGTVFFGLSINPTPFFGGTFYPIPFTQSLNFGFNGAGSFSATTTIPGSFPGGNFIALQFFFADGSAPQGVSGSNGLRANVP